MIVSLHGKFQNV
jgi:iron transport multicopper oxidase